MNILIIEDDLFLAEKIKVLFKTKILSNNIDICSSLKEFLDLSNLIQSYDIILSDIKLWLWNQNHDWYEIIKFIRKKNTNIPIVVISWNSEIEWLRYAFECWASDYIIKPIRLKELEVRVLNWYKNYYLSNISFLWKIHNYKNLSYNIYTNEFFFNNKQIILTKSSKYILSLFFASPEKLLKEDFLIEKIWWDKCFNINRNLRIQILRLKQSLYNVWLEWCIKNIRWEWYILKI